MRGDEEDDEMMEETVVNCAEIPNSFRELRACMTCSLVKTYTQFYESGCDNCIFLQMADNRSRVAECTSAYFEGLVAMIKPKESWVARWQRIVRYHPGIYAVTVTGELPESVKHFLEDRGIPYRVQS